jgi:hypothetical protein
VLREVCTGPVRIKPARLLLMLLPAAVGGFAAMTVSGLAIVGAALTRGTWRERWLRLRTSLLVLGVLSLPWLIPSMINPVHTSPMAVNLFAARADTPFGKLGSLVLLSGIWNSQTVPRGYGGGAAVVWLLIVACSLAGYLFRARARRMWPGVGVAGLVGLVIAAIGVTSPTRAVLRDLVAAWPGFAVLRDGQQFVGALALTEAIGLGAAVGWVMTHSEVAAPLDDAATPQSRRLEPAAAALAIMAMLAPLLLLPGLAWGLAGRLRPVQYPADWLVARGLIDHDPEAGSVLLLPWAAYRRYQWNNGGEAVYDPWNKLLSREVISNDGLQVGSVALPQEGPASIRLSRLLAAPGPLTAPLRAAGVRFVIVDAGPLLRTSRDLLDAAARLPGAQVVLASRDLVVFRLPGTG